MNSAIQRERLLLGLLTAPAQMQLYRSNLVFRGAIDNLTALLPSWVEGLVIATGRAQVEQAMLSDIASREPLRIEIKDPDAELLRTLFGNDYFPDTDAKETP